MLSVVWVDSAAAAVCGLARAVECADVLIVVKSVDLVTSMTAVSLLRMVMLVGIGRIAGLLSGCRSVANDAAAYSTSACSRNIYHTDALSDNAVLAVKILHELRLRERERWSTNGIGGSDDGLLVDRAS